jgi:hypothetical protein
MSTHDAVSPRDSFSPQTDHALCTPLRVRYIVITIIIIIIIVVVVIVVVVVVVVTCWK